MINHMYDMKINMYVVVMLRAMFQDSVQRVVVVELSS